MSKKKAFGGNTMTLKDFHGGSIPSDLPLPSAPGVTVRPSDRSGYDRPASWGNPTGRSRINSSTTIRHFDDKTPFLTPIGRNFDEDERKPLDGVSAPRRTISDDSIRASAGHLELKPQQFSAGRPWGQQGPVQVSQSPSQILYMEKVSGGRQGSVGSQNVYGNSGPGVPVYGSISSVWASRKEPVGIIESSHPVSSASSAASKLIHASALEKVSSGRWQSKQSIPYQADVEVMKHVEETGLSSKGYDNAKYNKIDTVGGRGYVDIALPRQIERNLTIDEGVHGARREISDGERAEKPPFYSDEKARTAIIYDEAFQPDHPEGRIVRSEFQRPVTAETLERPKLRLLPRSKPLENPQQPSAEHKQVFERPVSAHYESSNALGMESGGQPVERQKLNLKPRSQLHEWSEGVAGRDRSSVFGGARPRELVLKERGIDDADINNYDLGQNSERAKQGSPKTERTPGTVTSTRHSEKPDKLADQKNGRKFDRKDQQAEDRGDPQRNWRNENRKITRDNPDRQQTHHHHQQERRPSPEMWRRPVEDLKPPSPEPVARFRKAASAAELAQAFSSSCSNPKAPPIQLRAVPGQNQVQMPFSRLTGQAPQTQINGY